MVQGAIGVRSKLLESAAKRVPLVRAVPVRGIRSVGSGVPKDKPPAGRRPQRTSSGIVLW